MGKKVEQSEEETEESISHISQNAPLLINSKSNKTESAPPPSLVIPAAGNEAAERNVSLHCCHSNVTDTRTGSQMTTCLADCLFHVTLLLKLPGVSCSAAPLSPIWNHI